MSIFRVIVILFSAASAEECPKSAAEWEVWRGAQIEKVADLLVPMFGSAQVPNFDVRQVYRETGEFLERCPKPSPQVQACLAPLKQHAKTFFEIFPDGGFPAIEQSSESDPAPEDFLPPELMSKDFVMYLSAKRTLTEAEIGPMLKRIQTKQGPLKYAFFNGHSFAGAAMDSRRLIIEVPGKTKTWAVLARMNPLVGSELGGRGDAVRMATLREKKDKDGKSYLQFGPDWIIHGRLEFRGFPSNCLVCHRNGLIPIRPTDAVDKQAADIIASINDSMAETKSSFGEAVRAQKLGPTLGGDSKRTWTRHFINLCSKGEIKEEKSVVRVIGAMQQCGSCHGASEPKVTPLWNGLVDRYILSGHMPPDMNPPLSVEERRALLSCLEYDYLRTYVDEKKQPQTGSFQRSLTAVACDAGAQAKVQKTDSR